MKTTILQDSETVKLHVSSDGIVWYLDGDKMPTSSNTTIGDFVQHLVFHNLEAVRLAGTHENAKLITALAAHRESTGKPHSLQICSPTICPIASRRADPELMLFDLRRNGSNLPNSMGGWHDLTVDDQVTYVLITMIEEAGGITEQIRNIFAIHPLYVPLTFIPHVNMDKCCLLASIIVDPRWFVSQTDPDHLHKLFKYFGLDEKTQLELGAPVTSTKVHGRCKLVLNAWKTTEAPANDNPSFLWRMWVSTKDARRADLRTSQLFIEYLYYNWMNNLLYPARRSSEPLFCPHLFFQSKYDSDAYLRHITEAEKYGCNRS